MRRIQISTYKSTVVVAIVFSTFFGFGLFNGFLDAEERPLPPFARMLGSRSFRHLVGPVTSAAFAKNGELLISTDDSAPGDFLLWEVATGNLNRKVHVDMPWSRMVVSSDGEMAAAVGHDGITVYQLPAGTIVQKWVFDQLKIAFPVQTEIDRLVAVTAAKELAVLCSDSRVLVFDIKTGRQLRALGPFESELEALEFSGNASRFVAIGESIRIVNSVDGSVVGELSERAHLGSWFALSSRARYLAFVTTVGTDPNQSERLTVWDVDAQKKHFVVDRPWIAAVAFVPGQERLGAITSEGFEIWDLPRKERTVQFDVGATGSFWGPAHFTFHPNGKTIAVWGMDQAIRLFDVTTGKQAFDLRGHASRVMSLAFLPDGKGLISGGDDVRVWDIAKQEALRVIQPPYDEGIGEVNGVACSPDGRFVAYGAINPASTLERHGLLGIAEIATGKVRLQHKEPDAPVRRVGFSRAGDSFVSSARGLGVTSKIRVWDTAPFKERFVIEPDDHLGTMIVLPDPDFVMAQYGTSVAGDDSNAGLLFFDLKTGRNLRFLVTGSIPLWALAYSVEAQLLASDADKGTIQVRDVSTGKLVHTLKGHQPQTHALKFISKGQILISGGDDGKIRFWNTQTGNELSSVDSGQTAVHSLDVSADEKLLATGGADTTVIVWEIERLLPR